MPHRRLPQVRKLTIANLGKFRVNRFFYYSEERSLLIKFDFKIRGIARGVLLNTRLPSQLIAKIKLGEHSRNLTGW